mgnify:CR=1 FL=1
MSDIFIAYIVTIILCVLSWIFEKNKYKIRKYKVKDDPFYAYFFEDIKDFKNLAEINGCDYWHRDDDCIFLENFDDKIIRKQSRIMTPPGEPLYCASEVLNLYVYMNSDWYGNIRDDPKFLKKLRDMSLDHLKRFNREKYEYLNGRYSETLTRIKD